MSSWGDVASAVSKFAPILGNAVPGVGTLVGTGVGLAASVIAKALGTTPDPDAVMTALASDPDAIVKLRQAEMDHETSLAQIVATREQNTLAADTAQYATEVDDRKNARQRQVDTHDKFPNYLAIGVTLGFFVALAMTMYHPIPDENKAVVYLMLGSLGTAWTAVMAYTYGSTRQSAIQTSKITDFAVSPGSVTATPADATTTVVQTAAPQPGNPAIYRGH